MKIYERKYLLGGKDTPDQTTDRSLHGAFAAGDTVRFEVDITDSAALPERVTMEIHPDSEPDICIDFEKSDGGRFLCDIGMKDLCGDSDDGLFWYRYRITFADGGISYFGGERPTVLTPCEEAGDRQLLVYRNAFTVPEKFKGCVIYHIFVDRFRKGGNHPAKPGAILVSDWDSDIPEYPESPGDTIKNNTFFGGDLEGVKDALPYLESLGVEVIYLSPIFDSPTNHRYDTADYGTVDPMLGGDSALERLLSAVAERGICVFLDGVFNHTGDDSVYFNKYERYPVPGACNSKASPYYGWYHFTRWPDEYECWWGVKIMPRVDSENKSWQNFILGDSGVVRHYMRMGAAGFRLDVCDELSDSFLDGLRTAAKEENPESLLIGEVWEDATNKVAYDRRRKYLRGSELDSVMNYPFREAVLDYVRYGDHEKFRNITEGIFRRYPEAAAHSAMNVLGTHDTVRLITALAGGNGDGLPGSVLANMRLSPDERSRGKRMAVFALAILCALPGSLCIFYGDETGIEGYRDPFCRRTYPWGREDTRMIDGFRKITALRRTHPALRTGEFEIAAADERHLEIRRYNDKSRIIAHFNRSATPMGIDISDGYRVICTNSGEAPAFLPEFGFTFLEK